MKIANILLFFCFFAFWSQSSLALNQIKYFKPGLWSLTADSSYLYSDSNFTNSGSNSSLVSGNNYQLLGVAGQARYVLNSDWALFGGGNFAYAQSKGFDATRANSAITGMFLGTQYYMQWGDYDFIPEISYLLPFEKNSNNSDTVMTSEGDSELTAKMNIQLPRKDYSLLGSIGYNYRSNGRSSLLPWSAGLEIPVGSMTYGAELFGFQSLSDDSDKGNTIAESARNAEIFKVNAGSNRFYSLNPSLVDSNFFVRFEASRHFFVSLGGGYTFAGNNFAAGPHILAFLQYNFGYAPVKKKSLSIPVNRESRLHTDTPQKTFKEDTEDGVDQTLFEPPPLPAEEEIKPKRVQPPPAPTEEQVQQKLDDVEMSIELKRKKKK